MHSRLVFQALRGFCKGRAQSSALLQHWRGYRASCDDPAFLGLNDVGRLYETPSNDVEILNLKTHLPSKYKKQLETLNECVWMCREPFLEVVNCLKVVRPSYPNLRLVLWGKFGTGKSITLFQSVHYALTQNWIVFVVPSAMNLTRCRFETQMSSYRSGRVDCASLAVSLLQNFKQNNAAMWDQLSGLKTSKRYDWSKLDKTEKGRPITDIVEIGIVTPHLASDCVGALLKELKKYCSSGAFRFLVAIDDANSLYGKTTVLRADRTAVSSSEITLVHCLRKLFTNSWTNGACLLVADKKEFSTPKDQTTIPLITPMELFGETGLDEIDPFIPIETKKYSYEEASAMYDYYKDKHWIVTEGGNTERGRKEMIFLSAFNPFYFERLCAFL